MSIDRNYAATLITSLLSECEQMGEYTHEPRFLEFVSRTKMLSRKIFGTDLHYAEDLKGVERLFANGATTTITVEVKDKLRGILKTMLEELQLDHIVEVQAQQHVQASNSKGGMDANTRA